MVLTSPQVREPAGSPSGLFGDGCMRVTIDKAAMEYMSQFIALYA